MELVLVADESTPSTDAVAKAMRAAGHSVRISARRPQAALALRSGRVDAVLADPAVVGDEGIGELRARIPACPVIAWLPRASSDRVAELLAIGADEVLHAGMSSREQVARIEAVQRRRAPETRISKAGPLSVDRDRGEAMWHGRRLPLTARERDVLHALAESHGQTVRREVLYRRVWGYAMARGDRTVDVNVRRLRAKLVEAVGVLVAIETEPGVGYRLIVRDNAVTAL